MSDSTDQPPADEEVPGAGKQITSSSDSDDSASESSDDSDASSAAEKAEEAGYEEPDFSNTPIEDVPEPEKPDVAPYGEDEEQGYVDRDAADFDPEDGLYTGTAVDGGATEIPADPTEEQKQAALDDIKAGGSGIVSDSSDEDGSSEKDEDD